MSEKENLDSLLIELSAMTDFNERRVAIFKDIQSGTLKYKCLAEKEPYKLFKMLGGDETEIVLSNWALEYTYADYLEDNELEYDQNEADNWDLEERSIQHALEIGFWGETGNCILKGPDHIELPFEFEFCEGYIERITGTPYYEGEKLTIGILF